MKTIKYDKYKLKLNIYRYKYGKQLRMDSNVNELVAKYGFPKVIEAVTTRSKILIQDYNFNKDIKTNTNEETNQNTIRTVEDNKKELRKHRNAVIKKRTEIQMQDIIPETLLTKENLQKWLGMHMTYKQIARELTGCHERCIGSIVKYYKLTSNW
jgi:hypothetical protein